MFRWHTHNFQVDSNTLRRTENCTANIDDAKSLKPEDETVFIQRGLVYQDMGNNEYAIKDFKEAIRIAEA